MFTSPASSSMKAMICGCDHLGRFVAESGRLHDPTSAVVRPPKESSACRPAVTWVGAWRT